jgi:hypothetical protein
LPRLKEHEKSMWLGILLLGARINGIPALAQTPQEQQGLADSPLTDNSSAKSKPITVDLAWIPPAITQLST